jgi:hypothetical protein
MNVKTRILALAFVFACFVHANAVTIRILAIGNSFAEDAVEQYLYELGAAEGVDFIIGNMFIGGCSLEKHRNNAGNNAATYSYRKIVDGVKTTLDGATLEAGITDEPWDFITFQQVSQNSGQYSTYFPYLTDLLRYVKGKVTNENVEYALHQTWAYAQNSTHEGFANYDKDQQTMYDAIVDATRRVKESVPDIAFIIPSGTAIQNGRSSAVGDNFCHDGYHLDVWIGRYTAACTWFERITGIGAVGNTAYPSCLNDFQVRVAQSAAHWAVLHPDEVTSMAEYTFDDGKGIEPENPAKR